MLADQMVDGLILVGRPKAGYTEILKKKTHLPVVYLDFYENDSDIDCFISDNFYGTYLLTEYLIKKGHRQIAFLGTLYETQSITDRYLGFLKALMEHGMNIPENYIIQDRPIGGGTRDLYKKYRLPSPMPSAFVCNCDVAAVNLICELEAMGKKVPNDVSVVGFDHYPTKYSGYLGITTYEADLGALAAQALHSLIRQMKGETFTKGIHIVEGKLIEKESVCSKYRS